MKNEIIKLAQEKCKEYLKEKSITYHPSYIWLCQYIAKQIYEQMLKDAVEGEVVKIFPEGAASVHYQPGFGIGEMAYFCKADGLNAGEKVRIVVLKAEE